MRASSQGIAAKPAVEFVGKVYLKVVSRTLASFIPHLLLDPPKASFRVGSLDQITPNFLNST